MQSRHTSAVTALVGAVFALVVTQSPLVIGNSALLFADTDPGMKTQTHQRSTGADSCPTLAWGDSDGDGSVGQIEDLICVLDFFSEWDTDCVFEKSDVYPCGGGDGKVDMDDVASILDAFSGIANCPDLCNPCAGNLVPRASAGQDLDATVGERVHFRGSASTDPGGFIVAYEWGFPDGSKEKGENVSRVFLTAGTFLVSLSVVDNCGARDRDEVFVHVVPEANQTGTMRAVLSCNSDQLRRGQDELVCEVNLIDSLGRAVAVASQEYSFGDCFISRELVGTHRYAQTGTYTVSGTATSASGESATAYEQVNVGPDDGTPRVDFTVSELVAVDKEFDGQLCEEVWREIDLENEQIELGLRVKFDASISSEPIAVADWDFGDGTLATREMKRGVAAAMKAFSAPTFDDEPYQVTLRLYRSASSFRSERFSKELDVAKGMEFISASPPPGATFKPRFCSRDGVEAWCVSDDWSIGVFDVHDPTNLQPVQVLWRQELWGQTVLAVDFANGVFVVTQGELGVSVFKDPHGIGMGRMFRIAPDSLRYKYANSAAVISDYIYVAVDGEILVFNNQEVQGSPSLQGSIEIPSGQPVITRIRSDTLLLHFVSNSNLALVDTRAPASPSLVAMLPTEGTNMRRHVTVDHNMFAIDVAGGKVLGRVSEVATPERVPSIDEIYLIRLPFYGGVLAHNRLYQSFSQRIHKYNIDDPGNPYLMDEEYHIVADGRPLFEGSYSAANGLTENEYLFVAWHELGLAAFLVK